MNTTPDRPASYNPPRLPMRVRVSARGDLDDGASLVAMGWRILEPDEQEYEQVDQEAARAYRAYGWPMPYADPAEGLTKTIPKSDDPHRFKGRAHPYTAQGSYLLNPYTESVQGHTMRWTNSVRSARGMFLVTCTAQTRSCLD